MISGKVQGITSVSKADGQALTDTQTERLNQTEYQNSSANLVKAQELPPYSIRE